MPVILLLLALALFSTVSHAQRVEASVPSFDRPASNIVLLMFGTDHPVKLGEVNTAGALTLDVRAASTEAIPDTVRSQYLGRLEDNLHFMCDDRSALGAPVDDVVSRAANIYLYRDDMMAGALFAVSDTMLRPWLEDPGYQEPVAASFWEAVYTEKEMAVSTSCNSTLMLESGNVTMTYQYNLTLSPGFNFVEYVIQDIHKTDPTVMASKPSKVLVRTTTDTSRIRWVATHFM